MNIGAVSVLFVEPSVSYSPIVVSGVDAVSPTFGLPANCASYRVDEARPTIARVWYAAAGSIAKKIRTFALFRPASTRTIIRIIPVYLVILVIVEFHTLNDMITEPDTDIRMRLYVAGH